MFRDKIRRKNKPKLLWGLLHDGCDYGDEFFLKKYKNKKNFWTAWNWAFRNPLHNFYYSHKIIGPHTDFKGYATIQSNRSDSGKAWRTLLTNDNNGIFAHKYGKWINTDASILGKQKITFSINGKRYFRYSGAKPVRLWKKLWYICEYKFGFENSNWAIQFHPFEFKRLNARKINYTKIHL
jgi:hypothetical protein